jgi:hypothetical protein
MAPLTTATLTDRLPEIIENTWQEVETLLRAYFVEHGGDLPCLHNDLDYSGAVTELIDSAVPIWTGELNELAYFHHDAALQALRDQFGSTDGDWPSGLFAAGLYTLMEQGISDRWHDDAEDLWDGWTAQLDTKQCRELALSLADAELSSGAKQPGSQAEQEQN